MNGEIQTPPAVTAGPPLIIAEIAVPAGGNVMLLYAATANDYAPPCGEGQLTNTATLSGGALAEAITASAALSPNCEAELSITKAVEPAQVARNGELTYTFVITNLGTQAAEAADNIAVTDVFTPVLGGIAVTLNGTALDAAQYSYDTATGTFQTVPGVITVPAATFEQDADTGLWTGNPGAVTLTVTGTI